MSLSFKKNMFIQYLLFSSLVMGLVTACSNSDDELLEDRPVEQLYTQAMQELKAESYEKAAKVFDEVDRQHPYSKWATKAQLMAAFSHYQNQKYAKAIANLQTFIQLHPGHEDAAYGYYLLALCHYEQIYTVKRDQEMAELALSALEEVLRRFPETKYAKDAALKLDLTRDHLAGKEMSVGRYYLKRGAYLSAINRFRQVVEKYQTTTHTPEALHRLTESYLSLGLKEEAQASAAVLGHNFPGSSWYADSFFLLKGVDLRPDEEKVKASWLNRLLGKRLEG
jgi:outer membrane protein assembly factor BamD